MIDFLMTIFGQIAGKERWYQSPFDVQVIMHLGHFQENDQLILHLYLQIAKILIAFPLMLLSHFLKFHKLYQNTMYCNLQ